MEKGNKKALEKQWKPQIKKKHIDKDKQCKRNEKLPKRNGKKHGILFAQHMGQQNSKSNWLYTQMQGFKKTLQDVVHEFLGIKAFLEQMSSGMER